ncbi:MAG: hypothetical protein NTY19_03935 [Planctomycetota bacterium]|nr:hypothetical protein [Planctomycetota bacterium]
MAGNQKLPFAEAEGTRDERRQRLGLALIAVDCSAELSRLCEYIFNVTDKGNGPLVKSHEELASRPWRMCCSVSGTRKIITKAIKLKLIRKTENRYVTEGQSPNGYEIDWQGIERILRERVSDRRDTPDTHAANTDGEPGDLLGQGGDLLGQGGDPAGQGGDPAGQGGDPAGHPYKEYSSSSVPSEVPLSEEKVTPPDPLAKSVTIPPALTGEPFSIAWAEWISYRRKRRLSSSELTMRAQLESLVPLGPVQAAECLRLSIRNGWQGIFPERFDKSKPKQPSHVGGGQRYQE